MGIWAFKALRKEILEIQDGGIQVGCGLLRGGHGEEDLLNRLGNNIEVGRGRCGR